MTTTKLYDTSDIYLAATLKVYDIHLDGFRTKGTRTLFGFQRSDKCEDLIKGYYEGTVLVTPKKLRDALRELKTMTVQKKKGPEPI